MNDEHGIIGWLVTALTAIALSIMVATMLTDPDAPGTMPDLQLLGGLAWAGCFSLFMWVTRPVVAGGCLLAVSAGLAAMAIRLRVIGSDSDTFEVRFSVVCAVGLLALWTAWAVGSPHLIPDRPRAGRAVAAIVTGTLALLVTAWLACPPLHPMFFG